MVSRRRFDRVWRKLPRARSPWVLDSGGFSELSLFGHWTITPREYVRVVRLLSEEVGRLEWAAGMDWMCEPHMLQKTGLTIRIHQSRTIRNFVDLQTRAPEVSWLPVLQGWTLDDYRRHADAYRAAGVPLNGIVGVGSVCRRRFIAEVEEIVRGLSREGLRLHCFGVKMIGLRRFSDAIESSDSMAWSYHARRRAALPGCPHQACASCFRYALQWRSRVVTKANVHVRRNRALCVTT